MNGLEFLPEWSASALLAFAVALTVKATVVLGGAAVVAGRLRSAAAATRHLVWCCAMVGLLALPALSLALPEWRVGVLPAASWGLDAPAPPVAPVSAAADGELRAASRGAEVGRVEFGSAFVPAGTNALPTPATRSGMAEVPLGVWGVGIWLAGVALVLLRLLLGQIGVWRLERTAGPLDASFRWLATECAMHIHLRRPVEMLRSPSATMPMTWGVFRPKVLLPAEAEEWPMERRRAVITHELAHVKRLDCLTQMLALVCCAVYWFHPGAWWAARRMRIERETACDDAVLDAGFRATDYAGHLLEIARAYRRGGFAQLAAVAMARPSQLEGRLLAVLDAARSRAGLTRRAAGLAAVAALLAILPLSALRPTAEAAARVDGESLAAAGDTLPRARAPRPERPPFPEPVVVAPAIPPVAAAPEPGIEIDADPSVEVEVEAAAVAAFAREVAATTMRATRAAMAGVAPAPAPRARTAPPAPRPGHTRQPDPRAVAALIQATRDPDAGVRRSAILALAELEDTSAVPALVQALRDPSPAVRKAAAHALAEIGDRRATEGLIGALGDSNAEVRKTAAHALAELEDPRATAALGAALRDPDAEVRRMAAHALSELGDPAAVPALIVALRESDPEVRRMVAHALGEIEDQRAVEPLIATLRDRNPEVRKMAAWALSEIGDPRAAPALASALSDTGDPETRRVLIHALTELDLASAPQALLDALRDPDRRVRITAIHALAEIEDPRALPALRQILRDPDVEVRRAAVHAILEFDDPESLDLLIELLRDSDPEVRRQAAAALGRHG